MRLIELQSYSNRAECIESHWRDVSTLSSKYSYANSNIEDFGGSAERAGGSDIAISSSKPGSTAPLGARRSGIPTGEQMDSRGSVRHCDGTACWRRRMVRDAAGEGTDGSRCLFRAIVSDLRRVGIQADNTSTISGGQVVGRPPLTQTTPNTHAR